MKLIIAVLLAMSLVACGGAPTPAASDKKVPTVAEFSISESGVKTKNVEGFGGVIAESYSDSKEWWPPEERPEEGSPNVIIFLLDDVGFAQVESFGGLISTPNIDALADNGLRYNNFPTLRPCVHPHVRR